MSFILDALKKSESDRQRQSGPALFEVKVAPPRAGLPAWAIGVLALLTVNLGILGWMLWRRSPAQTPPATAATSAPPATAAAAPAGLAAPASPAAAVPTAPPAMAAPAAPLATAPLDDKRRVPPPAAAPPATVASTGAPDPAAAPAAAAPAAPPGEDDAPATEPAPGEPFRNRVRHTTSTGLPLYPDAAAAQSSGLPMLRLDLHVFAARPQERFILINMHRLREGDVLPEGGGVRVEGITPDGAVLERNGTRWLLPRE